MPPPDVPTAVNENKRPINKEVIERLSIPRKIKSPDQINYTFPNRPLKSADYYDQLSQPRRNFEDQIKEPGPKLTSMKRTLEISAPLPRLQRRKFMKGDKDKNQFPVSRAALEYKASAKINKLAVPRVYPEDPNQRPTKGTKSKKKK